MSYENIKDLDAAEIRFDDNGEIRDLDVAVFKDNILNFTKFSNLPIYNKYQIDSKIKEFEETMTSKLQEKNMIGSIYVENSEGELVPGYLKLSDIANKLNRYSCNEVGTRYNINSDTGKLSTKVGKRVVKQGNRIYIENIDSEATGLLTGVGRLLEDYETEVMVENKFTLGIYPWNKMKKVQISMDDSEFNYDLSVDNGGNYFTEVPLYYVKEQYLLEQESKVTGLNGNTAIIYNPVYDLTSVWDNFNISNVIPQKFKDDTTNVYSIGMYKWVSKYPLQSYRPAEFFVKKVKAVPTVDDGTYDNSVKRYVKIKINERVFYQLYESYAESDIFSEGVTTRYCLINSSSNTEYVDVLTSKHYFGCYEAGTETYNGKSVLISKPGIFPTISTQLSTFRARAKNLGSDYYIRDMRSYTDFYGFLMDIEYKTLNSQDVINGVTNLPYSNTHVIYFNQTNTNKVILPYSLISGYTLGQTVICGTDYGSTVGFSNSIITEGPTPFIENEDFIVEKDRNGDNILYYYTADDSDGNKIYGTNAAASLDSKEYYKINISTVSNDIYVIKSLDGSDIATALPTGVDKEDALYYYDSGLYASMSGSLSNKRLYKYKINKTAANLLSTYMTHTMSWKTGTTDILTQRTAVHSNSASNDKHPFKWNWIENPYVNIWKFIDGIYIQHNAVPDVDVVHNAIYICDNPDLYVSNASSNYDLITSYYSPGKEAYCTKLGFDPKYPWVQLTVENTGGNTTLYYGDYFYQNSTEGSTAFCCVVSGGSWAVGGFAGLRSFQLYDGFTTSVVSFGAAFERQWE